VTGPIGARPRSDALPTASVRESRARIARLLRDRRRGVLAVVVLTGLSSSANLAGPALIGVVVDVVAGRGGDRSTIARAAVAFAVLGVVGALFQYAASVLAARVGEDALVELRSEVFEHALHAPIEVIERGGTGDVVSRVTGDVSVLVGAVRETVPRVAFALVQVVLTVGALALVDVRLALVALAGAAPLATVAGRWYLVHAPARYQLERERHAELAADLLESFRGRATLVASGAVARTRLALARRGRAVVDAEMATTAARNVLRTCISGSLALALVAVIGVGSALVRADAVTVGAVSAAALYVVRLFDPIGTLFEQADGIQQAGAATARLVGITQVPPLRPSDASGPFEPGRIDLDDVSFGYEEGVLAVAHVDLHLAAGERVAVVGPSGAGKTTLGKLICGTHAPLVGAVRVGGRPCAPEGTRAAVMIAQEPHVFARTIVDNVRVGRPDADDEAVAAALVAVGAERWVAELPDGLDTVVGHGGHLLTASQAQQLGLARLVCADPAIVILDEATADMDPIAAARTERHLDAALAGRTVIAIAHRLDVATRADRVVVMEHGAITEVGTHGELVSAGGTYAQMWRRWMADHGEAG
jgi:ATP-binding cassette, subfamily C, bacterial